MRKIPEYILIAAVIASAGAGAYVVGKRPLFINPELKITDSEIRRLAEENKNNLIMRNILYCF
jgi:hypothetical protein